MARIARDLASVLRARSQKYPIVTVTGPRQAGKSTLCRMVFPDKTYVNLEPLDRREFARSDPRGFLEAHRQGAIFDEVHHVPDLFSYLQAEVDERPEPGRFILTGSQHLGLTASVTQSLAGRTSVMNLFPLTLAELRKFEDAPQDLFSTLWTGGYPAILDRGVEPHVWLADYVATYVQRDVRQIQNITDLNAFTQFIRLCAGRTAGELHWSALGGDAGVSHNTARSWFSLLEAGFLCFSLPAWHRNIRKQLIKAPKLHFYDSGLVCHLLGIRSPDELRTHPLRGAVFETWVAAEVAKGWAHAGQPSRLAHLRVTRGPEVDLVIHVGSRPILVECKSGQTIARDWFDGLEAAVELLGEIENGPIETAVVYGGDDVRPPPRVAVPWHALSEQAWAMPSKLADGRRGVPSSE